MYLLIITAVLTVIWWVLYKRKKTLDFPGPRGWPFLGNLPQLDSSTFHLKLTEWAEKYNGCYKINLFGVEALVISDSALVHECQVTRGAEFAGRGDQYELREMSGRGAGIIFADPNPLWRRMRKLVHSNIRAYDTGLERIEQITMESVDVLVKKLEQLQGEEADILGDLYLTTMNIITSLLVGRTYAHGSEFYKRFRDLESSAFDLVECRMEGVVMTKLPVLERFYNLLHGPETRFLAANDAMFALVKAEVEAAKSEGHTDSLMCTLLQGSNIEKIPPRSIQFMVSDVIIAGTTTTTNTLHQFINIMAHHQEIQEKLHMEIYHVLGERPVTLKDREQMPYHQAALIEILRFTTLVPIVVPHKALQDTQILGRPVPAGTTIFFNHFALNHNEALFPDPYTFRPERFLDENGSIVPADHPNRRNMNAFGSGPRVCVGEALAKGRLFLVMASLMRKFRIALGDETVSCDPRNLLLKFLLCSLDYKIRFISRSGNVQTG